MAGVLGVHELGSIAIGVLLAARGSMELPSTVGKVRAAPVAPVVAGGSGELSLTLLEAPAPGFPIEVRIAPSAVSLKHRRLDGRDIVDPLATEPRLSAPFTAPPEAGSYPVTAVVSYVTCSAQRCRTRRATIAWSIEVTPAPQPAPPP